MNDQNEMLAHKIDEVFHQVEQRYLNLLPGGERERERERERIGGFEMCLFIIECTTVNVQE